MRILLARHGETPWNAEGRYQGQIDIPLSPIGEAQAQALGARLASVDITRAVASPLSRAQRTAQLALGSDRAAMLLTEPDLQEIAHGEWEGLLASEINEKDPSRLRAWREEPDTVLMPGGESLRLVLDRSWRGLARAALNAGAVLHTETPVTGLKRVDGKWTASTARGPSVVADRVVMCTNAYGGGLWPGLKPSIIDANTFQVATAPLPERLRAGIFPEGHVTSDTRNLLLYFRLDHQGRLLMGGRGPFREPRGDADWAHLERVMVKMFPQVAGTPFEYRWCGRVAITRDYMPHLHEPQPGLLVDIGCQGRGVGLQTSMGRAMAEYVATGDANALPVPLSPIVPFPLYGLRRLYVNAVVTWYRMTDGGV